MFSVSSFIIEIIEIKKTSTKEIIFSIAESEDNNDEKSSNNEDIENLDLTMTAVIIIVVNATINAALRNLSAESSELKDSSDSFNDEEN